MTYDKKSIEDIAVAGKKGFGSLRFQCAPWTRNGNITDPTSAL